MIVFDDLVTDTRRVYENVLAFLDVPSDDRVLFPRENPNRVIRVPLLSRIARRPPRLLFEPYLSLKKRLGWGDLGFTNWLKSVNEKPAERQPLASSFRLELVEEFRNEVVKLELILDRDLSHWKR